MSTTTAQPVSAGAIVNGRTHMERLEGLYSFACEAGPLSLCDDWHGVKRCFEHLASQESMLQDHLALALRAVGHVIKRMTEDPRLAYLIGPGSETFDRLVAAAAAPAGMDEAFYAEQLTGQLTIKPLSAIGAVDAEIESELLARIAIYDDRAHDMDDRDDLNMMVNHFIKRGLDVAEAERDNQTERLF